MDFSCCRHFSDACFLIRTTDGKSMQFIVMSASDDFKPGIKIKK